MAWPGVPGILANTYPKSIAVAPASNQALVTAGMESATALAARAGVAAVTPSRLTTRAGSLLQDTLGSSAVPKIGGSTAVDDRSVGIAVLDSGIDCDHRNLNDAAGNTRVSQVVDIVAMSQAFAGGGWTQGADSSTTFSPLSALSASLSSSSG